jgi:NitT/TauT family transport system ATP-binding protein
MSEPSQPATAPSVDVHVRGVSHTWIQDEQEYTALSDIDLHIQGGEFFSIVGPSGCGKSTLLRIIAGLQMPSSGEVLIGGSKVEGPRPDVGMVFQDASLFPWLTALDNVAFGPRLSGVQAKERRDHARDWLSKVGLTDFEKYYPHQLSGGMKQRVAIARVLANGAQVLLMDEPFSALDYQARRKMQDMLQTLWGEFGKTVVFVTHHIDEAVLLSDQIAIFTPSPNASVREVVPVDHPHPRVVHAEWAQAMILMITSMKAT